MIVRVSVVLNWTAFDSDRLFDIQSQSELYCVRCIPSSLYYNDLNLLGTFHFIVWFYRYCTIISIIASLIQVFSKVAMILLFIIMIIFFLSFFLLLKTYTCMVTFKGHVGTSLWCGESVSVKRRLRTSDCGLQTADCRLRTRGKMQRECKMQTADWE